LPARPCQPLAVGAGSRPVPHGKPVDYKGFAMRAESPAFEGRLIPSL